MDGVLEWIGHYGVLLTTFGLFVSIIAAAVGINKNLRESRRQEVQDRIKELREDRDDWEKRCRTALQDLETAERDARYWRNRCERVERQQDMRGGGDDD